MGSDKVGQSNQSLWGKFSGKIGGKNTGESKKAESPKTSPSQGKDASSSYEKGSTRPMSRREAVPSAPTSPGQSFRAASVKPAGQNSSSVPAFYRAALDGDLKTLQREVYAGAPVNAVVGDWELPTALFAAVESGSEECVRFLLGQGANYDARRSGIGDWTPLMHAVCGWHEPTGVIKALLEAGADPTALNNTGTSPLKEMEKWLYLDGGGEVKLYALLKKYDKRSTSG